MKKGYILTGFLAVISAFYFLGVTEGNSTTNSINSKQTNNVTEENKKKAKEVYDKYKKDGDKREAKVPKFNKNGGTKIRFSDSIFTLKDARLVTKVYTDFNTYYAPKGVYMAVKLKVTNTSDDSINPEYWDYILKLGKKRYRADFTTNTIEVISPEFSDTFTLYFDVPKNVKKEKAINLVVDAFYMNGEDKSIKIK